MSDRRVVRGITTKVSAIPSQILNTKKQRQPQRPRRFIPPTKPTIFDLKPEQEDHVPVSLDAFLVEKEKVVSVVDIETQTDEFEPLPPPAHIFQKRQV